MKQINILFMALLAIALPVSCRKSPVSEEREGVPMTIQANVIDNQADTKTSYTYTSKKTLVGSWKAEESLTVVSFGENGITAVDTFYSSGEEGRMVAVFNGTWTGNEGDKIICLYPSLDTYAGVSLYNQVDVGSPFIVLKSLSTASSPLQDNDTDSVSAVDMMMGEVTEDENGIHVSMNRLFSVFRITATLANLPYYAPPGSPYEQARINTLRISAIDTNENVDPGDEPTEQVFVRESFLNMTTDTYSGKPASYNYGPMEYYLISAGNDSDFCMDSSTPVTKTFYVPVRIDGDLLAGYELRFQFGGNYYDYTTDSREQIDVFPAGDKRKVLESTLPLDNGKIYGFTMTI